MEAEVKKLYHSSICSVHDFLCHCHQCSTSPTEHQEKFTIAYVRKGNFQFKVFRNDLDAFHGLFLINKEGHEYRVGHAHELPDQCTLFTISNKTLEEIKSHADEFHWFFKDPDMKSVLVRATPETEHLHHAIFQMLTSGRFSKLWLETLIAELFLKVLSSHQTLSLIPPLTIKQKRNYLPGIESVKRYVNEHFTEDISLSQLADLGNMSVFHFNRLFKKITSFTPYQYLLRVRLEQAHLMINNTKEPVTDIAFDTGFQSLEHFSASYKHRYGQSPSDARR
jgi:AraC family transcriptional regulator